MIVHTCGDLEVNEKDYKSTSLILQQLKPGVSLRVEHGVDLPAVRMVFSLFKFDHLQESSFYKEF